MSGLTRAAPLLLALALAACGNANNGRLQGWVEGDFVFVGPDDDGPRRDARRARGRSGRGRRAAVRRRCRPAAVRREHHDAQVAEARARLARLEAAQQRTEEVAVLEAQERRAEAMLMLSTAELERQQTLTAKGVGTQAALDTAKSNFNRDTAALDRGAPADHGGAALGARGRHRGGAPGACGRRGATQQRAETKLARRKLASPVSGAVQQIYFRPGEMVPAGTADRVAAAAGQRQGALLRAARPCCRRSASAIAVDSALRRLRDAGRRAGQLHLARRPNSRRRSSTARKSAPSWCS